MKRRWFTVLGVFFLVGEGAVFAIFGFPALTIATAVSLVLPMVVGVLFVLGGLSVQIGTIRWYQFVGTGDIILGIWFGIDFSLTTLHDASLGDGAIVFAVIGIVGGLNFVFIGIDWIRGGHYLNTSQYEKGSLFGPAWRNRT